MTISIIGYKYIQHNLKIRAWGYECQFTFISESDGRIFDDVISVPSLKIGETDLEVLIEKRLLLISKPLPPPEIIVLDNSQVENYLKAKGIIKPKHTLDIVKTTMSKVAEV